MNFVTRIIRSFIKKEPLCLLGRWNIDNCIVKMNKKIDLSNEDHCGTCSTIQDMKKNVIVNNKNK